MVTTRPAETKSGHGQKKAVVQSSYPESYQSQQLFITSAISMSWQMALAVLIPIVGGYYLDQYFKTAPWVTLAGLIVGVLLVVLIVRRTIKELPEYQKRHESSEKRGSK